MRYFISALLVCFIFSGCATTLGVYIGTNCKNSVEMRSIEPDTYIEITLRNHDTINGTFIKLEEKYVHINLDEEEKEIPMIDIKKIEVPDYTCRWICIGTGFVIDSALFYFLVIRSLEELGENK